VVTRQPLPDQTASSAAIAAELAAGPHLTLSAAKAVRRQARLKKLRPRWSRSRWMTRRRAVVKAVVV
jgi:hypothetical protein